MKMPKMLKITYMGEPLRNIYPHATRFQVFKYRLAIWTRRTIIALFALGMVYGAFYTGRVTTSPVFVNAEDKSQFLFDEKIEKIKDGVIETLMKCESAGATEADGLVVYDPLVSNPGSTAKRNIPSFGQFQFKKDTVIHYYKMKTGVTLTAKEAVMLA